MQKLNFVRFKFMFPSVRNTCKETLEICIGFCLPALPAETTLQKELLPPPQSAENSSSEAGATPSA